MSTRELCVIFNPAAGRGQAQRRLERLRHDWATRADFQATERTGHAEQLAARAAQAGFRIVAAAGGDGTVHEVANGLLRAGRPDVHFAVLPIGSANDYAHSLDWDFSKPACGGRATQTTPERGEAALPQSPIAEGDIRAVDVGRVRAAGRERYFVCCLGLGLNGAVTLESRRIRRLQGLALYGLATLRALWYHYCCPNMEIVLDDQPACILPTLMLSVLIGRREGGFVLAPKARLDDGWFDYVHAGALSRWEVLRFLPRLALAGPPAHHPKVRLGQCRLVGLHSEAPLTVHIDGEFFSRPEDNVRDLEIQILPACLRVRMGLFSCGPSGRAPDLC